MANLEPCPFCGGEELEVDHLRTYDLRHPDVYEVHCPDCGGRGGEGWTEAEAIEAWNTRAQTVFGMTLDEVRQMMKRDAERNRTCKCVWDEQEGTFHCSSCGTLLTNEISIEWPRYKVTPITLPNYCPCCGAKVVSE